MMGTQQHQNNLWSYHVNLDQRVRPDHPLRQIDQLIDFTFIRGEVKRFYGDNGNVSVDPVVILKLMFLLFYDDVRSERELMRIVPERLDYLWFLGYGLDDEVPDHSVLSKARRRWGREVFEELFRRVLLQCLARGLVEGGKIHFDASLIRADASLNSIRELPPELVEELRRTVAKLQEPRNEEAEPKDQDTPSPGTGVNQDHVSLTDPASTLVRHGSGKSVPSFKHHRAVDDRCGVITAVETTTGMVDEGQRLESLIEQHRANTGLEVKTAVADSKYGTNGNFVACQKKGIRSHMANLGARQNNTGRRKDIFGPERFKYDRRSDTYQCPAGQTLHRRRLHPTKRTWDYLTERGVCGACALRRQCTRSASGRSLQRHEEEALLARARRQSASRQGKRDRKRRQHLQERSFADAANRHGFKRARWRGLWRQQIQDLLIAAIQNIRILLRAVQKKKLRLIFTLKLMDDGIKTIFRDLASILSGFFDQSKKLFYFNLLPQI